MKNRNRSSPISVPPSQAWDGNDGPWSTFHINTGNPPQPVRVLVSTVVGETWVISDNKSQGGCLEKIDNKNCPGARGGLMNINDSTTWKEQGIFALGVELNLPDYTSGFDNGNYGMDSVGLGLPNGGGITLNNQVVGAVATKAFYLGNLGVTSRPTNFTGFNDPHTSLLSSLREENHIPSLSFGYTAGNQYRLKKVFGSLTLGGYDKSKFVPNDVSIQFATDISRDLLVGLQAITYSDQDNKDKVLSSDGVWMFVDATVPHLWLPKEVCKAFEKAFGLTYNSTVNRYLVNDTLHESLQEQKPEVSFTIGNSLSGGATVKITLPYDAFDLTVGPPIVNSTSRYFPLRQADNDTQYTLGRTFLQESYLTVDYERSNFSLSQCLWEGNKPVEIVAIPSANLTGPGITKTKTSTVSVGAIVGIVVAIVVLLAIIGLGVFFFLRRRRREHQEEERKEMEDTEDPMDQKPELGGIPKQQVGELYGSFKPGLEEDPSEMEGSKGYPAEKLRAEMEGSKGAVNDRKSYVSKKGVPVEMWAGPHGLYELSPDSERPSPQSRVPSSSGEQPSPESPEARKSRRLPRHRSIQSALYDSSGVSSPTTDDPSTEHENSGSELRKSRPRYPPRAITPQDISPQSSRSTRTRRGDDLTRRLEQARSKGSHLSVSSPTSASGPVESKVDRWNARFGSRQRDEPHSVSSPSSETPDVVTPTSTDEIVSLPSGNTSRKGRSGKNRLNSWTGVSSTVPSPIVSSPSSDDRRSPGGFF